MKALHTFACVGVLLASFAGVARADDTPTDATAYKQKLHDCQSQMKTDHPDMNHEARRKACRKQLGPMPKVSRGAPSAPHATTP